MAAHENRFAPELNEKEVIELLEDLSYILGAFLIIVSGEKTTGNIHNIAIITLMSRQLENWPCTVIVT